MQSLAPRFYPECACAKTYKDNFVTSMTRPVMVPSVDNLPETYEGGEGNGLMQAITNVTPPMDRPKNNRNKKHKRLASRGEKGLSKKSKSVYKGKDGKCTNGEHGVSTPSSKVCKGIHTAKIDEVRISVCTLSKCEEDEIIKNEAAI